jgi:hypothetical protein
MRQFSLALSALLDDALPDPAWHTLSCKVSPDRPATPKDVPVINAIPPERPPLCEGGTGGICPYCGHQRNRPLGNGTSIKRNCLKAGDCHLGLGDPIPEGRGSGVIPQSFKQFFASLRLCVSRFYASTSVTQFLPFSFDWYSARSASLMNHSGVRSRLTCPPTTPMLIVTTPSTP